MNKTIERQAPPGQRMTVWDGCRLAQSISKGGIYSKTEVRLMSQNLKTGQTFVDLGAHVGYFTLLMAKIVGSSGCGFAFEPHPENFALLKKNVEDNGHNHVKVKECAISNRNGRAKLFLSEKLTGDHHIYDAPSPFEPDGRKSMAIDEICLDDYMQGRDVNFIKMDIQGAEGKALEGMQNILSCKALKYIIMEFWPVGLKGCGTDPREVLDCLLSHDFCLFQASPKGDIQSVGLEQMIDLFHGSRDHTNLWWKR